MPGFQKRQYRSVDPIMILTLQSFIMCTIVRTGEEQITDQRGQEARQKPVEQCTDFVFYSNKEAQRRGCVGTKAVWTVPFCSSLVYGST